MPIHKEGSGYEWGNQGKVYHGKNAREKAEKQAAAAHANGFKGDKESSHEKDISQRIKREYERGHPLKQAEAIAYSELGEDKTSKGDGKMEKEDRHEAKEDRKDEEGGGGQIEALLTRILERMDAHDERMDRLEKRDRKDEAPEEHEEEGKKIEEVEKAHEKEGEEMEKEDSRRDESEREKGEEEEHEAGKELEKGRKEMEKEDRKDGEPRIAGGEFDAKRDMVDRKDARMDSLKRDNLLLKAQLSDMRSQFKNFTRELTPEDRDQLAQAQKRADSVFQMLGEPLTAPLAGERPTAYRTRLAKKLQKHSSRFKETRLDAIQDRATFDEVERNIYDDAKASALKPSVPGSGRLIPITETDMTGTRKITRYIGDSKAAWKPFMAKGHVLKINQDTIARRGR